LNDALHPDDYPVQTWDFEFVAGAIQNGTQRPAAPVWFVYEDNPTSNNALRFHAQSIYEYFTSPFIK
jgi:hypothetical protein